jgi:hypothetical protein
MYRITLSKRLPRSRRSPSALALALVLGATGGAAPRAEASATTRTGS